MNSKFMDLLNRLFNRIEKDAERNELAIEELHKSLHKNELNINQLKALPKEVCTKRFEKVEGKLISTTEKMIWVSGISFATMILVSGFFTAAKYFKWF